jgi:arylsulfate sulfotransferase
MYHVPQTKACPNWDSPFGFGKLSNSEGDDQTMRKLAPLQPCLLFAILTIAASTLACGGAKFNDPPGFSATAVANTQNPLVAQYTMTTALGCPGQVSVEFGPDTSYGRSTAWYPATAGSQTNTILVAGMKASTTYHMRAQAQAQCSGPPYAVTSDDTTFTTGPLPSLPFPALSVTRPSPSATSPENPGIELIDIPLAGTPAFFTDRDGNPIWYYDVGAGNYPYTFKSLPNGHMIVSITLPGFDSTLQEIDLAGNIIQQMDISVLAQKMAAAGFDFAPEAYHHDLFPLPNGHVIVLTFFTQNYTDLPGYPGTTAVIGDALIDLDPNWNPVWAWNSFDHQDSVFNVNRHLNGLPDWTHSNGIVYTPVDGNLMLSMRHQSFILKIDYNNGAGAGDILWKLGYQGDFSLSQSGVPTSDPGQWFSFQHFPSLISQSGQQTSFALWDNGDFRVLDNNGTMCGKPPLFPGCFSRASVLNLDESTLSANLEWTTQPGYYGVWGGSINQLANGNIEFDANALSPPPTPGLASEVQEVTQTSNPQIVWKMDITSATQYFYRAYRVPSLYPGVIWQY